MTFKVKCAKKWRGVYGDGIRADHAIHLIYPIIREII